MQDSRIIEVDGVFLGAAVSLPDGQGWRVVAADERLARLNGTITDSVQDARRVARQLYLATRQVSVFAKAS
ncbi:MAG TPA: hypothetical protein VMB71_12850 [Acetobacteraceae bacterium]|nr:hypothetical protein [Acetobacteraceae bacterium]